jgi:hypothetical protein
MPTIIYADTWDRDRRLRQLGLDRRRLIEAVKAKVAARGGCTDNDAQSAPGYMAWNAGVRVLREFYRPEGWEKEILNGLETIKPAFPGCLRLFVISLVDSGIWTSRIAVVRGSWHGTPSG